MAIDTHSQGLTTVGVRTPEQVRVLTIGDEEPLVNYAKSIVSELRTPQVRATGDFGSDPMKAKIANAERASPHDAGDWWS